MRSGALLFAVLAALAAVGCNYRISSGLDGAPSRTIHIVAVENQLFPPRAGLEYGLARRLKDEIAVDRRLRQVNGGADIQLKVSLVAMDEPTIVKFLDSGLPAEVLLRATVVIDASGPGVIGERRNVGGESTNVMTRRIRVSDSYATALGESSDAALERLWRDMAREIIDAVTDHEWAKP